MLTSTYKVGGWGEKRPKHAYIIFEWPLSEIRVKRICVNQVHVVGTFNMSYLIDSYILFTLKMESVSKNTIFGLKMMVKSGLEKYF